MRVDQIGKHVMRGASATLTPTVLELGGKDPMVITEDADLSQVVQIALRGTYQNCGQNCIGVERMYVYEAVHDEFVQKVQALVSKFRQGPGLLEEVDVGATTMPSQLDLIQTLVDDAVAKGAKIVCGGKRKPNTDGLFFEPTVLTGVTHDMRIANEEVFGPVMSIIKVSTTSCCTLNESTYYADQTHALLQLAFCVRSASCIGLVCCILCWTDHRCPATRRCSSLSTPRTTASAAACSVATLRAPSDCARASMPA